jgi:hypothetical protein
MNGPAVKHDGVDEEPLDDQLIFGALIGLG